MCKSIYLGVMIVCLALFPATPGLAQHCQPYWTAQYKCAVACGPCGGGGGYVAPRPYVAPQPTAAQIAAQRASAIADEGVKAEKARNWTLAMSLYEQALRLNPNSRVIRGQLGHVRAAALNAQGGEAFKAGNWALAITLFERALQVTPKDKYYEPTRITLGKNIAKARAAALNAEGIEARKAGNWTLAITRFEQALRITPKDKYYEQTRITLNKNIAFARASMQEQAQQDEQKRQRQQDAKVKIVATAQSTPAKNVSNEWVCPPDLPQIASNPARFNQPDGHYCIAKNSVPCGGPSKSWACEAGHSCNGDGSDPKVVLCR